MTTSEYLDIVDFAEDDSLFPEYWPQFGHHQAGLLNEHDKNVALDSWHFAVDECPEASSMAGPPSYSWLPSFPEYCPSIHPERTDFQQSSNETVDPFGLDASYSLLYCEPVPATDVDLLYEQTSPISDTASQYSSVSPQLFIPASPMSRASSTDSSSTSLEDPSRFMCAECRLSFATSSALEDHAKIEQHKSYQCPDAHCRKKYRRRDVYVRHKATHNKPSNLKCSQCTREGISKTFARRDHYKQHVKTCHPGTAHLDNHTPPVQFQKPLPCSSTCCRLERSDRVDHLSEGLASQTSIQTVESATTKEENQHKTHHLDSDCESEKSEGVTQIVHGLRRILSERHKQRLSDIEEKFNAMHSESKEELARELVSTLSEKTGFSS